ncbi:dihydrolipoamide dehydrogenase [Thalassobaculum fulvum]|uniref:Dihydrolipoamide dehydrogenase n=1 Tax=Thalassobaculum fulvum TaxID=1633335 RepID=A0A919CNG6_9PROT|nr:FAD-dependent oxidoreductase [Thalassobaculum fulvum]GHD43814.1 dihydrolipoamide dehydrogenase [Thalassobaculum fulvum]
MTEAIDVDLCVIGAGAGGLSVAAGASQMGASVVLFERGAMGGDCLNVGCVPSKALLAAAHAAHGADVAGRFGLDMTVAPTDWRRVREHVRGVIAAIAPVDSVERYEGFGVRVIPAHARFTGPRTLEGGGVTVRARFVAIATGSTPSVPPLPGLDGVAYLTNETVFDLDERPSHLLVLGGGAIGCELAQAHARLGCRVTLVEAARLLGPEDPEAADVVRLSLRRDGIDVREGVSAVSVGRSGDGIALTVNGADGAETLTGSHLLVATGRRVSFEGLDLDRAGIATDERGRLVLDARLRTSNRRVFAVGDAAGGPQFTHVAGAHAGVVIKNTLFRWPARADNAGVPRVTFTAPELAQVGPTEAELRSAGTAFGVLRWPYAENDRAQAERSVDGFAKVLVAPNGRILGATVVGDAAGELISVWALAIAQRLKVGALAGLVVPYPTRAEIIKRVASSWYVPKLFGDRTRALVRFLMRFA